jgi:hypothetical protein
LIYSPSLHAQIRYRPSYAELADSGIRERYRATESEMATSREGSEYVRKKIAEIDITLEQLSSLPMNWDSYGSQRPSQRAVSMAGDIAKAFISAGLVPDALAPSPDGGIAVCFMRNKKYADIECFNTGHVLAVRYSSHEEPKAWEIQPTPVATDATIQIVSKYLSA